MRDGVSTSGSILRLSEICSRFDHASSTEKRDLLMRLYMRPVRATHLLKRFHSALCFLGAFPDTAEIHALATGILDTFERRVRKLEGTAKEWLLDSGIAGTDVQYTFTFASMVWLTRRFPNQIRIDWNSYQSHENLAALLQFLASLAEQQVFDDNTLHTKEWLKLAHEGLNVSELEWLFHQFQGTGPAAKFVAHLYDNAEVPVTWSLGNGPGSITHNRLHTKRIACRSRGLRRLAGPATAEICKPLSTIRHLKKTEALKLLDVVNAALLARCREVYHMQHANPEAVYLASCGEGVQIAFIGADYASRFSLDVSNGYMVFANGIPIAYGGVSPLFFQANTGLNVLDEFRRGESAFIYTQVLRMAHTLFGCSRFIVNPYQFGEDNTEALKTGAFWFYYRLGFRPVDEQIRKVAEREFTRIQARKGYRTPKAILKKLATGDLHLLLPGMRRDSWFPEEWLGTIAAGATRLIASQGHRHHARSVDLITADLRKRLPIRDLGSWSKHEREALLHLSPVLGLIEDLREWPGPDKRRLVRLIKAKGAPSELKYVHLLRQHERLYRSLRSYCRGQT